MGVKIGVILLLITTPVAFAAQTAKVLVVKGKVTKLIPNTVEASSVKRGDLLPEDTSVLTGEKSFIRLRFSDKSTMNLGPNSKVVITKLPEKKANMVNLLTGMIKAEVKKKTKKESKTKLVIQTRTAVMGVRGTKFQAMYNAENKATSLVTVEGKVAMAKQESIKAVIAKSEKPKTLDSTVVQKKVSHTSLDVDKIDEVFSEAEKSNQVVEVSEGKYSGVADKIETPTEPVKIAPKQYDVIAKSMGSTKKAQDVMKLDITDTQEPKVGSLKSGGYLDFESGLYVEPAKDAQLDKTTGTYKIEEEVGQIDNTTGDYIPPKGVVIDAKKGFVVDVKESEKVASNQEKEKLLKTVDKLNKKVEDQVVVNKVATKPNDKSSWKIGPKNHIVSAELKPFSEVMTVKNKFSGSEVDFYTESAHWFILSWQQVWNDKWSSAIRIGGQEYELDESDVKVYHYGDEDEDEGGYFSIGVDYKYTQKTTVSFDLVNKSLYYVVPAGGDGVELRPRELGYFDIGVDYKYTTLWDMPVSIFGSIYLPLDDSAPAISSNEFDEGEEKSDIFGFGFGAKGLYNIKPNLNLNSTLWYERFDIENDELKFTKNTFGFGLDLVWDI